jgi:hypothetical protein
MQIFFLMMSLGTIEDDIEFILKLSYRSEWTTDITLGELSILRAFHGVEWRALGKTFLNCILLAEITPAILRKSNRCKRNAFVLTFMDTITKWRNGIEMMFPKDGSLDMVLCLCSYIPRPEMAEWSTNETLFRCFGFLHSEKIVSTQIFETWANKIIIDMTPQISYKHLTHDEINNFIRVCKNKDKNK